MPTTHTTAWATVTTALWFSRSWGVFECAMHISNQSKVTIDPPKSLNKTTFPHNNPICAAHHITVHQNKGRLPKWKNRQTQKSHQPNNVSVVRHHIASNRSTNPCRAARLMTATLLGHVDILSCCMKTSICVMVFDIDTLRKSIDSTSYSDVYIPIFKPNPYTWANLPASEWINAVDWCRLYSRQYTYMGAFCIVSCLDYA